MSTPGFTPPSEPGTARFSSEPAERATLPITADHPAGLDPLDLLDHRTRERMLTEAQAPPGRYLALEHGGERLLIVLRRHSTHIGRGLSADIRVEDPHVSRHHAIVAVNGHGPGSVRVLDDRSCNGTFVNGRETTAARLTDGDIVRVGQVAFRYTEIEPASARQRPRRIPLRVPQRVRPRASHTTVAA